MNNFWLVLEGFSASHHFYNIICNYSAYISAENVHCGPCSCPNMPNKNFAIIVRINYNIFLGFLRDKVPVSALTDKETIHTGLINTLIFWYWILFSLFFRDRYFVQVWTQFVKKSFVKQELYNFFSFYYLTLLYMPLFKSLRK